MWCSSQRVPQNDIFYWFSDTEKTIAGTEEYETIFLTLEGAIYSYGLAKGINFHKPDIRFKTSKNEMKVGMGFSWKFKMAIDEIVIVD